MKKLILSSLLMSAMLVPAMSVHAKEQRTCILNKGETQKVIIYDTVKFDCGNLGSLTIKQINSKGWSVIQMIPTQSVYTTGSRNIVTFVAWTLLIEKP